MKNFQFEVMASNYEEGDDDSFSSDSSEMNTDTESGSECSTDSDTSSDAHQSSGTKRSVCKFYNDGHCRYGKKCRDLHVCKSSLDGSCRYGAACRLKHVQSSDCSPEESYQGSRRHRTKRHVQRKSSKSSSPDIADNGRPYQWQLKLSNGWEDVANDHILEAQYSRPNTKGIKIYNTPCGALSIDFCKMRILKKKKLRIRRKGSPNTKWLWHYRGNHGWHLFGEKDSKGKNSSVSSDELERLFQNKQTGNFHFTVDSTKYEIVFNGMYQKNVSTGHKRRIRRRPQYESPQIGGVTSVLTRAMGNLSSSSPKKAPLWQFGGQGGKWHSFKHKGACSVSSEDIEAEYQRNPQGSITFTVKGSPYIIDFSKMTQTNLQTRAIRNVQRI